MVSVVGFRKCSGKSKQTGKSYSGCICFYEEIREGTEGVAAESVFLSDDILKGRVPPVGGGMEIHYDRRGYVTSVEFV